MATTPRPKRPRKATDGPAYHEMMTRLARRAGVRAGNDVGELPYLADVQRAVDAAMTDAVVQLRLDGHSWAEIGAALGRDRRLVFRDYAEASKTALAARESARAELAAGVPA
jgi:hypothetical protein